MIKNLFAGLLAFAPSFCAALQLLPPSLTAEFDSRKNIVTVKWVNHETGVRAFVIQRSDDDRHWVDAGYMQLTGVAVDKEYVFLDRNPLPGSNYYRLKVSTANGDVFAPSVMVITTAQGNNNWVMYPVPVTTMLNLQYKGYDVITGVVNVFIQNMNGRIITRYRGASINKTIQIPVDNLGKGIYDVRIVIGDNVVWNQRFVK